MAYKGETPTAEQIREVEEAAMYPQTFDDDCPELTDEQIALFIRMKKRKDVA